jgi:hypothetical protein
MTISTWPPPPRGVVVTNTPGVLDEEVADLTLGLLLATIRRIPQAERHLRAGLWAKGEAFPLSPTLRGRRVGILGLGAIGKAVARRLEGFGVEIAYHGRTRQDGVAYPWYPSALALAEAVDVLVVVVPGGAATAGLVDAAVLRALGPQGVLVNVARGSVVDEAALIAALQDGTILAAGLDVYAREPQVPPRWWRRTMPCCCRTSARARRHAHRHGPVDDRQSCHLVRARAGAHAGAETPDCRLIMHPGNSRCCAITVRRNGLGLAANACNSATDLQLARFTHEDRDACPQ